MNNKSIKLMLLQEIKKFLISKYKEKFRNSEEKEEKPLKSYYKRKRKSKFVVYINILFLFLIIMFLTPQSVINASTGAEGKEASYNKIIKFNIPYLSNENLIGESNFFKRCLGYVGLDLKNPLSIMEKEVAYFKDNSKDKVNDRNHEKIPEIVSFDLNEEDIVKIESTTDDLDNHIKALIDKNIKDKEKPRVLIYHTHTHEGYAPGGHRSKEPANSVTAVGDILTEELEKLGVKVIHDKTAHDLDYNSAYYRSRETLENYLKEYGGFDLIIDLHRDSAPDKKDLVCSINGENSSRFMFVTDKLSPLYNDNLSLANKLLDISDSRFPGFARSKRIYEYEGGQCHFSTDKSSELVVLEVGSFVNDISESKNTGKYIARVIAEYIGTKNE